MLQKINEINGLQIVGNNQLVKISKSQFAILNLINKCVEDKAPLTMDMIVKTYTSAVKSIYSKPVSAWQGDRYTYSHSEKYDIYACYKRDDYMWRYTLRPNIKTWFTNNLGILIIKNKLIVIPIIEIGYDEEQRAEESGSQE